MIAAAVVMVAGITSAVASTGQIDGIVVVAESSPADDLDGVRSRGRWNENDRRELPTRPKFGRREDGDIQDRPPTEQGHPLKPERSGSGEINERLLRAVDGADR